MDVSKIKVIIYDTFGTVVDWHGTIVDEGIRLGKKYGFSIDWNTFANVWREEGYIKVMHETAMGLRPWERVDVLHKRKLLEMIEEYGLTRISKEDIEAFNLVWHRCKPWPDSVAGLTRLKQKYAIGPFSNGDFRLLLNMAKHAGLPWDFIITTEIFEKFKPDPTVYVDAVNLLGGNPQEVLMVAAHPYDLDGAKEIGCSTIFVPRPSEYGPEKGHTEPDPRHDQDMVVADFNRLADALEA